MSAISTYMLVFIPKRLSIALSSLSELVSVLAVLDSNLDRTLLDLSAINPQPSLNNVTRHNRSNTLRRARKHNIALLQRHDLGNIRQLPSNPEKHQLRIILLLHLPINLQPQLHIMRILNLTRRNRSSNRQESIETLGDAPRQTLLLGLFLHITPGHVDGQQVALDRRHPGLGVILVNVAQGLADYDSELDFVVQVHAARAQDGALGGEQDGGGGLEEEEGLFGALVVELLDVVGVVAADAHDLGEKVLAQRTVHICTLGEVMLTDLTAVLLHFCESRHGGGRCGSELSDG
jgi:hypothetical protein